MQVVGAEPEVLAAPGEMGHDVAQACGLATVATGRRPVDRDTTAADTKRAARTMLEEKVELLMVAGGDGTLRDVFDEIGTSIPLIGIPAGVKMHSGVFAATPEAAGETASAFLAGDRRRLREAEIADIDEGALRAGRVVAHLHGWALVPHSPHRTLRAKAASPSRLENDLDAACAVMAAEMTPGRLYLVGPGTTTERVLTHLGLEGTVLGVDAILDGQMIGRDLDEAEILSLLDRHADVQIIAGVVGGQGSLFGRGNQQLGAEALRRVGRQRISIVAGAEKLAALHPEGLRVDTGDPEVDRMLCGHSPVIVAPSRTIVMKITT